MARFYRVKFNDLYLSSDGTNGAGSIFAKVAVTGADVLLSPFTGTVVTAVDGTPVAQVFETGTKGKVLEFRVETYLFKSVWESIVPLINDALSDAASVNLVGVGDIGNFDVEALPLLPRPFEAAEFENGRILKPIFRFITI